MQLPLLSIISVNYNHSHVTDELLDSIYRHNTYSNIEIIVVDNASTINPVPEWQQKYPEVLFIRIEKNLGFAGGNNLGLSYANGTYFFLVNNDTEFTPLLIETLLHTLETHPQVGVVCPKIKYFQQPDTLQYVGFTPMNYYTCQNKCVGQFEKDNGQYDNREAPTGFAHGAAMMLKKEAVAKAGLMHENYFLYYEEGDWCDRIKKQGFEIWVNTKALIYHKESVSVGQKSALKEYFMNRNRILFIRRNAPYHCKLFFLFYFILIVTPKNIISYIKDRKPAFIKQLARAIYWNITQPTNSVHLGFKP